MIGGSDIRRLTEMEIQARQHAEAQAWPDGVIARYLTIGGAHVDLTHQFNTLTPPEAYATFAACSGCPATSEHDHHRVAWGRTTSYEKHDPDAADQDARDWAQAHAEKCRALPRPQAAQ